MNSWRGWGSKNDFECPPLCSGHIQRKNYFNFAFVAACGPLQTHFHRWSRKGRWHICRLPCILLCESWIQKRPQAFLNPKFKMKFLNLWPKRMRRPFQIVPQGLAHRGSFLTKTNKNKNRGVQVVKLHVPFLFSLRRLWYQTQPVPRRKQQSKPCCRFP